MLDIAISLANAYAGIPLKKYECTDCGHVNYNEVNGEIRVGFCNKCDHLLWNS
jgi:hypothetical protein